MVVEMTGKDVEVICGEWETGNIPKEESGENYNVILSIELIKRHPKFQIDQDVLRTNFVQDDIAAITVKVKSIENVECSYSRQVSMQMFVCLSEFLFQHR